MAHSRKELAFGAARPLRRVFGAGRLADGELQVQIGVAEIDRAFLDLLLEKLTVLLQPRVAKANLTEHLIEAVDERADFIVRAAFDTQAVVFLQRYPLHGLRQIDDGSGDLLLQTRGEPKGRQHRGRDRRNCDEDVAAPIRVQHLERHEYLDEPQFLSVAHDGCDDAELIAPQEQPRLRRFDGRRFDAWRFDARRLYARRHRRYRGGVPRGRRFQAHVALTTAVGGELMAVLGKDFGFAHQPFIAQPAHGLQCRPVVADPQRLDRIRTGHPRDARRAPLQVFAQMQQIHRNVSDHRDGKNCDRGHHDDHAQLALDGKVREPTNQLTLPQRVRFYSLTTRCRLGRKNLLGRNVTKFTLRLKLGGAAAYRRYVLPGADEAAAINRRASCQSNAG